MPVKRLFLQCLRVFSLSSQQLFAVKIGERIVLIPGVPIMIFSIGTIHCPAKLAWAQPQIGAGDVVREWLLCQQEVGRNQITTDDQFHFGHFTNGAFRLPHKPCWMSDGAQ